MGNVTKYREKKKPEPKLDLSTMLYGKAPPQAKDLEEAILGAIMLEKGAFDIAAEILKAECFYLDAHQRIFKAMVQLSGRNQAIDILTVVEQLKVFGELEEAGGPYFVTKLTKTVVTASNLEMHARIVLQKFMQRELIRICGESLAYAYEDSADVFELLDGHERQLTELTTQHLKSDFVGIENVAIHQVNRIESLRHRQEDFTGIPSGYRDLDAITYGWQNTDLIIIAARPSVGKTAFALNLARNAALNRSKPSIVAFFSLEMSAGQLVNRILSAESEIWLEKIQRGKLEDHEMKKLYEKGLRPIIDSRIKIDDTAAITSIELRAKCRRIKRKFGLDMVIVDYLQLMSGTNDRNSNREQEISRISRDLKGLAKELQVPIIALSQLSREVEKRKEGNKIPQLSDLRESGAIEQDADMVMFLYRPEYYDINTDAHGESTKGETHVRIAKHRNGDLGMVKLSAQLHIQKFTDLDQHSSDNTWKRAPSGLPAGNWHPVESSDSKNEENPF